MKIFSFYSALVWSFWAFLEQNLSVTTHIHEYMYIIMKIFWKLLLTAWISATGDEFELCSTSFWLFFTTLIIFGSSGSVVPLFFFTFFSDFDVLSFEISDLDVRWRFELDLDRSRDRLSELFRFLMVDDDDVEDDLVDLDLESLSIFELEFDFESNLSVDRYWLDDDVLDDVLDSIFSGFTSI